MPSCRRQVGAEPTRSPVEFTYTVTTQGRLQSTEEFENIMCAPTRMAPRCG